MMTGSYHHPQSMALADFFQKEGRVLSARSTSRGILTSSNNQVADILDDIVRGEGVHALALGSRLVPFQLDGFSVAFANQQTDRMAIGLTKGYIFIVQGVSDLWRLSRFMRDGLGASQAINADGGHVVKGRGPVHRLPLARSTAGQANRPRRRDGRGTSAAARRRVICRSLAPWLCPIPPIPSWPRLSGGARPRCQRPHTVEADRSFGGGGRLSRLCSDALPRRPRNGAGRWRARRAGRSGPSVPAGALALRGVAATAPLPLAR